MEEIWQKICDGKYAVSSFGRVKSMDRIVNGYLRKGKIFRLSKYKRGYLYTSINGKSIRVHRLVAQVFIPNPNNLPQVNHKDGNKENNRVDNLEWVTARQNVLHAYSHGLIPKSSKI